MVGNHEIIDDSSTAATCLMLAGKAKQCVQRTRSYASRHVVQAIRKP